MVRASKINRLPHWARVAFGARCMRWVLPIFEGAWPDAEARRREALSMALRLVDASSEQGAAVEGVDEARAEAVKAAGAALMPLYRIRKDPEPMPKDEFACHAAAFAAKVAEWAARAAMAAPDESAHCALEAYTFARDAGQRAGFDIQASLDADLTRVAAAARRNRWNDQSPVPCSVFDAPESPRGWRFWKRS